MIKISHTSSQMYSECGVKYDLHYNKRIRPTHTKSALVFGKAIDNALNDLLVNKNIESATKIFIQDMTFIKVNGREYNLDEDDSIVIWTKSDVDPLISEDARTTLIEKGKLMIRDYHKKVLPKIKEVVVVQQESVITNSEGDKVAGALDLIVVWEDGRRLLMDNKTASKPYEEDSAGTSPQLTLYYWAEKDHYKLDAVGYIVMSKKINHNEKKTCKKCGFDGSGAKHKTCNNVKDKVRCNGEWEVTYTPECDIQIIINEVDEKTVDKTFEVLDNTNHGITNEIYEANKNSCYGKFGPCVYRGLCHKNSMEGLEVLESKDDRLDKKSIS